MIRDLAIAVAALVGATLLALALGAVNLGTALTFGVIAFMAAIVGLIVGRGPQSSPPSEPAGAVEADRLKRPRPSGRPGARG